jgi:hypothetical protein
MVSMRPLLPITSLTTLAMLVACSSDGGVETSQQRTPLCESDRPAVAYQARAEAATGSAVVGSGAAPTPCFQLTGHVTSETSLAVQRDGTVLVAPVITAEGTGVLRSRDQGAHWETLLPEARGGTAHGRVQPIMHVDPDSERVLFATARASGEGGFDLSISDDAGNTWRPGGALGAGTVDWIKLVSGPPVTSTVVSGSNVLYASSPAPISTAFADHQQVQRSLDGGETWTSVSGSTLPLKPVDNGCPEGEWVIYGSGVTTPDGALYLGLRRCTRLGIAVSRDQGESWTVSDVPGARLVAYAGIFSHYSLFNLMVAEPLATDSDGNLYAVWNDEQDALQLSVSRDQAVTWSAPLAIAPPGVPHTVFAAAATRAPGVLAVAFYGSDDDRKTFNAYVVETQNALEPAPTFWGARLNSPKDPPLFSEGFDLGYRDVLTGGDLLEIIQVRYAPDGDLWASFSKDMCPGQDRAHCTWDLTSHANGPYQLGIGRLRHPR